MSAERAVRGATLLDLLVGTALGMAVLSALTAAVVVGARLLTTAGARGEGEDNVQLAVEALAFDVRRAGYDPRSTGVEALTEARADRLALAADLDGDGAVDATSEETTAWVCSPALLRLSRIIGRQSLPLADGVGGCGFRYLDASGATLPVPTAGLAAADRLRVRALALDVTLRPPGLATDTTRSALIALRSRP